MLWIIYRKTDIPKELLVGVLFVDKFGNTPMNLWLRYR